MLGPPYNVGAAPPLLCNYWVTTGVSVSTPIFFTTCFLFIKPPLLHLPHLVFPLYSPLTTSVSVSSLPPSQRLLYEAAEGGASQRLQRLVDRCRLTGVSVSLGGVGPLLADDVWWNWTDQLSVRDEVRPTPPPPLSHPLQRWAELQSL